MHRINESVNQVQRVPPPQEMPIWVKELAKSKVIHACESSLAAVIFVPAIELFLGNPIQTSLPWISLVVALSFGLVIVCNWLHLGAKNLHAFAAIVEAHAEILLNRDLNGSGAIGDRLIEGHSEIVEDDTNAAREAFSNHVAEFIKVGKVRGISRNAWIEHRGINGELMPAVQWSDGTSITKGEYLTITDHLVKLGKIKGRRKGREGELDDSSLEIA